MTETLPCPFCGHDCVDIVEVDTFRWRAAECDNCSARAPCIRIQTLGEGNKEQWEIVAKENAILEWNKRYP